VAPGSVGGGTGCSTVVVGAGGAVVGAGTLGAGVVVRAVVACGAIVPVVTVDPADDELV